MSLKTLRKPGRIPWYIRGTVNGTRYDETTGTTDYKTAEAYRIKREQELHNEAIYGKAATATFAQAALEYLEQGGSKRFLLPVAQHFGNMPLSQIGQEQIDHCAKKLYPRGGPATRNRQAYTPALAVLKHAARLRWCPAPAIKRPKQPVGRVRWITRADAARLVNASARHLQPLLWFLFLTGARAGEALWLDWSNLDLDSARVTFTRTKNGEARSVPLHPELVAILRQLPHRAGAVFLTQLGKPYRPPRYAEDELVSAGARIRNGFQTAVRKAGLTDFHPHDCRHTWATWHYRANRDLIALMRLGGWKSLAMVQRYAHVNVDDLADTIGRL
jgi:integrase